MGFLRKLLNLGPLDSYKTILGALLLWLPTLVPGFPVLDLAGGITAAQILVALAALKKVLEKFKKK